MVPTLQEANLEELKQEIRERKKSAILQEETPLDSALKTRRFHGLFLMF